jgi:hypothetical protein
LERDQGLNLNGDATEKACLTWLPIDRTLGSTDLNAKSLGAGLVTTDLNYCSRVDAYVTPKTSYACSVRWRKTNSTPQQSCFQLVDGKHPAGLACPPGHYGVMGNFYDQQPGVAGGPNDGGENLKNYEDELSIPITATQAARCGDDITVNGIGVGDLSNGCPFMCVPYNSTVSSSGPSMRTCIGSSSSGPSGLPS